MALVGGQRLPHGQKAGDGLHVKPAQQRAYAACVWRAFRRGRGRRLRLLRLHGAGELLRQLHHLRHAGGIRAEGVELVFQFRHGCTPSLLLHLAA